MPLSWNEIKGRAIAFSKKWDGESSEDAEAKSFWDDFFNVFGISRRRVATFEHSVKKLDQKQGFIDLLWKGTILIEHKSRGKSLDKAVKQAKDYFSGLKEHELPKYILVSDFQKFRLYDLDADTTAEFEIQDFISQVHLFGFIAGYEKRVYKDEDPVNIAAAELMGKLHDRLKEIGYTGHDLEVYLVRLLFCMFADDTNIFEKGIFWQYIDLHTKEDGSDLAMHIASIFHVLNTPNERRLKNLDENLSQFPYVNGKLFEEPLQPAAFDSKMREMLLEACAFDWGKISPAIFGSMFQAVMNQTERRNLGAHYTSEKNIQKLIKPLFLDDLYVEFEKAKGNKGKLEGLHNKISHLHFLDPACGCGNFLIITYRELRELEILILLELNKGGQLVTDVNSIIQVDVDQFAGIEYDEFAVRVAEVAMWLIDHQMNVKVSNEFGQYFVRLPLKKAARIVHGNSLRIDWHSLRTTPSPSLQGGEQEKRSYSPPLKEGLGVVNRSLKIINNSSSEVGNTRTTPSPSLQGGGQEKRSYSAPLKEGLGVVNRSLKIINYVLIPRVSSENRKYIPMGFFDSNTIASDTCITIPNGDRYIFGVLTSEMHMTWVKYVCGRLKSDFRYSNTIVYNNYPFPENISDKQKQKVEDAVRLVLAVREKYTSPNPSLQGGGQERELYSLQGGGQEKDSYSPPCKEGQGVGGSSLADLYDPLTMPPDLVKAHQALDKAVDLCYRPQPFVNELNRIEYLFSLYEALSAPLLKVEKKKRTKRKED